MKNKTIKIYTTSLILITILSTISTTCFSTSVIKEEENTINLMVEVYDESQSEITDAVVVLQPIDGDGYLVNEYYTLPYKGSLLHYFGQLPLKYSGLVGIFQLFILKMGYEEIWDAMILVPDPQHTHYEREYTLTPTSNGAVSVHVLNETGHMINNSWVYIMDVDQYGEPYGTGYLIPYVNETLGYYMTIPVGPTYGENYYVNATGQGFQSKGAVFSIKENEVTTVILSPNSTNKPVVQITKPSKGLYIFGMKIFDHTSVLALGKIKIEAIAFDYDTNISHVEFYVGEQLMKTVNEEPYTWTFQKGLPLQIQYTVKVVAYDNDGKNSTDEITIWKFF